VIGVQRFCIFLTVRYGFTVILKKNAATVRYGSTGFLRVFYGSTVFYGTTVLYGTTFLYGTTVLYGSLWYYFKLQ